MSLRCMTDEKTVIMLYKLCIVFSVTVLMVAGKNEDYDGAKIYNIKFTTQQQQDRFNELKSDLIDYLRKPSFDRNVVGKAVVPPSHFNWFDGQLEKLGVERDVAVENVQTYLADVERGLKNTARNDTDRVFDFNGYYRYDEILNHIYALETALANSTITFSVEEFAKSEQNRSIVYIRISDNTATVTEEPKPVVVVEAAINPREWITVPSALNIVNRLVEDPSRFLARSDWVVVPVLNPDGYEYTHNNLRYWTKTLSTTTTLGSICPGVNINRNFDIAWMASDSSSSPCSHLYAGLEPFSEPETKLIQHLLEEYNSQIRLYISLQNNGGYISYPWLYERAATGMFRQQYLLGLDMVAAMNDDYKLLVGWEALSDTVSGTSADFVHESGVLFTFIVDAVQRGEDGVSIPEEEIVDVVGDVWRTVAVAAERVLD